MRRLVVAAVATLCACGLGFTPPGPPTLGEATRVNASFGRTWDAVIDQFANANIPIRTIERASGIIATEQLSVGAEGLKLADCGKQTGDRLPPDYAIYNVLVRGDSSSSTVKATVRWTRVIGNARSYECSTKRVWEQAIETAAKAQAESRPAITHHSSSSLSTPAETPTPATQQPTEVQSEPAPSAAAPVQADQIPEPQSSPPPHHSRPIAADTVLLRDPSFARAVDDLRDFNSIDGFQETGSDTLTVSLTDAGITAPAAPHYLRRLFDAYRGLAGSDDAVMLLTHRGRLAGTYSTLGLSRRDWR